jgi:serine/threonine-protein kinase
VVSPVIAGDRGASVTSDLPDNTIGKYRLIAELGRGGMSEVYLAVAQGLGGFNKLLVVKVLRADLAEDPEFLTMFLDEARLAARLSHRNVVQCFEVGAADGHYYIAMEYLEGQPLNRIVHRAEGLGGVRIEARLRIIADALSGLHYAHELRDYDGTPLGIVHRDVSPHNLFVTYAGEVKVVDFGIAKALDSCVETRSGVLKGKLSYMPPEQARSERVDRRADVFSAGVMVWEAAAGRRMWQGLASAEIAGRLITGKIPSLRDANPSVSPELVRICERALATSPLDRYQTAAELGAAIEQAMPSLGEPVAHDRIGARVVELFHEDWSKIQSVIERQLKAASGMSTGSYEKIQIPVLEAAVPLSSTPSTQRRLVSPYAVDGAGAVPTSSLHASTSIEQAAPHGAGSRRWWPGVLGAGAAVLLVVGGLVGVWRARASAPESPSAALSSAAAPQPTPDKSAASAAPAASVAPISVVIEVDPSDAKLFVDDRPVTGNPHRGTYAPDQVTHRVRAEALGYVSRTMETAFDKDIVVKFALDRARAQGSGRAGAAPAKDAAAPDDGVELVERKEPGTKKPKRKLDSDIFP